MTKGAIPEIVTTDGRSVEVKRIPDLVRNGPMLNVRGRPRWHWEPVVTSGATKVGADVLVIARASGVAIKQHILVLAVPATMSVGAQRRVHQLACRVVAQLTIEVPVRVVVVPVPPAVF